MFNEMFNGQAIRPEYKIISDWIAQEGVDALLSKRAEAEALFRRVGITFNVYGDKDETERLIPFDMIPRVFGHGEWAKIEAGVIQRTKALNAFLVDIYGAQDILKAGKIPSELVLQNEAYEPIMQGFSPPAGIYSHITGVDLVRVSEDEQYVLEDNCRTPSGISYVLQNRELMERMFPQMFRDHPIAPVDHYGDMLAGAMAHVAPPNCLGEPNLALLTPGHFNSAYYEHSFLADLMGIELVEGGDLIIVDDCLFKRTTEGLERIDVLYRRIDDAYIDPEAFRADSMLGIPGIIRAMKAGNVTLLNAPGSGVADDKAVYTFVPDMIRFYLGEEPIIPNVPTWQCGKPDELSHVLDKLPEMVVKEVHGSGGYGMLIGPAATKSELEAYADRIKSDPGGFIAQPTLNLSAAPTLTEDGLSARHVDFRPYVISGQDTRVIPGGLTRVALTEGSLVVNSSQGGGVKDTWIIEGTAQC